MVVTAMHTNGSSKLTPVKRKELMLNLCRAMVTLRSPQEMADALTDLFTSKEIETVAKRLQIAEYLVKGWDYHGIRQELKVGYSTIARINTWLNLSGTGFRIMLSRKKKSPEPVSDSDRYDPYSWHNIKRRYSLNFWPQLLLDELIKGADEAERAKITQMLDKLAMKTGQLSAESNKHIYESFSNKIKLSKIPSNK